MHLKGISIRPKEFPATDIYPFSLQVLQKTEALKFIKPVTFFVGENGCGKSTLLRAIATKCGIHLWRGVQRRHYNVNKYADQLHRFIDLEWEQTPVPGAFFESEMFHNFAEMVDECAGATPGILEYYGGQSFTAQSHGQYHMSYFQNRYKIEGLYFMDEPENALSPRRQLELLTLLKDIGAAGHAQFIIASHSPILLALPGAVLYSLDQAPIKPTYYEETEYYKIYKDFLNHRERFI